MLGIALASGAVIGAVAERPGPPAGLASEAVGDVSVADPALVDQRAGATGRPGRSGTRRSATDQSRGKAWTSPPATASVWSLVGPASGRPTDQQADQTAGQLAERLAEQPAEQPPGRSADEPTEQPAAQGGAERPAARQAESTTVEAEIDMPEPDKADFAADRRPDIPPVPGCEASVPDPGTVINGQLDDAHLCPIGGGHKLRPDAAAAFLALDAAYHNATGERFCVTDSYRSLGAQISLAARKPGLAARPGTSEHGWGLAVDIGCGVNTFDGEPHKWLVRRGERFGWTNPGWAREGASKPEPWHWEFDPALLG